jgi:NAD(P)-dependent dehydrogenase (short-subunit alcohol dehydrogenase family)
VGLCDLLEDRLLLPGRPERSSTGEGGDCTVVETDVSRSDQVGAMIEAWLETYGRSDILHNNVGILEVGGPVEASEESWDRVCQSPMKGMTCKVVCRA